MDIIMYCLTPGHQVRSGYRTGALDQCNKEWDGLKTCIRAKATAKSDPAKAKQILRNWTQKWADPPPPPVWRMRRVAPIIHASQLNKLGKDPTVVVPPELIKRKSEFFGPADSEWDEKEGTEQTPTSSQSKGGAV